MILRVAVRGLVAAALAAMAGPVAAQAVRLSQPAPILPGIPALPRIASPATPQTAKINAALARADARWQAFDKDCKSGDRSMGLETDRRVTVSMRGPAYFALDVTYNYNCGGAHPDAGEMALVYDLATGRPVAWLTLLPPSAKATGQRDSAGDGSTLGFVVSPVLHALFLKAARADPASDKEWWAQCEDVLNDPAIEFQLIPEPAKGGLTLVPDLAHVVAACGDPETLSTAQLRKLGVDARLVDAIEAAGKSR